MTLFTSLTALQVQNMENGIANVQNLVLNELQIALMAFKKVMQEGQALGIQSRKLSVTEAESDQEQDSIFLMHHQFGQLETLLIQIHEAYQLQTKQLILVFCTDVLLACKECDINRLARGVTNWNSLEYINDDAELKLRELLQVWQKWIAD
jgi:hypothetical protein